MARSLQIIYRLLFIFLLGSFFSAQEKWNYSAEEMEQKKKKNSTDNLKLIELKKINTNMRLNYKNQENLLAIYNHHFCLKHMNMVLSFKNL